MKLAILTNILAPYRIPLFSALSNLVDDFKVFVMAEYEENRQWHLKNGNFNVEILPGFHKRLPGSSTSSHFNHGVIRRLRDFDPDVVLSGGFLPANLTALSYCKCYKRLFVGWGELTTRSTNELSGLRRIIRELMTRLSDGYIASSSEARKAFIKYGAKSSKILLCPMPVDVDYFYQQSEEFRRSADFYERKSQYTNPIILSVGRMVNSKGYYKLFEIFKYIKCEFPPASLILVGDGPRKQEYEDYTKKIGLKSVYFIGFIQQDILPKYYALADIFIFHTLNDKFGAVLSEAMATGTLAASSIYAAATYDLVIDGVTGFHIDPLDCKKSSETILYMLRMSSAEKEKIIQAANKCVKQFDIESSAENIILFVKNLLGIK